MTRLRSLPSRIKRERGTDWTEIELGPPRDNLGQRLRPALNWNVNGFDACTGTESLGIQMRSIAGAS